MIWGYHYFRKHPYVGHQFHLLFLFCKTPMYLQISVPHRFDGGGLQCVQLLGCLGVYISNITRDYISKPWYKGMIILGIYRDYINQPLCITRYLWYIGKYNYLSRCITGCFLSYRGLYCYPLVYPYATHNINLLYQIVTEPDTGY